MAFTLHNEGEEYMLDTAFSETQSAPASFYLGLCDDVLVEADTISDILGELAVANGYARQTIASSDAECVVAIDGEYFKCTFAEQTFTAAGAAWDEVNTWFICTTSDAAGVLIASGPIDPARTLGDGDSMNVETYIRLK